jgi:DNA invertase Pin-like site-specific DNA recombinase
MSRAAAQGWNVSPECVYVDNNLSASHGGARPAYERLVADVKSGKFDTVIAWNLDRLTRTPREIEDWIDLNEQYGVNLMTSEGSDPVDMSTEVGRLVLRITAAVARQEVERKGRRQRESNDQARELGFPTTGRRSFGYTPKKPKARTITATRIGTDGAGYLDYGVVPIDREADAIRWGFERVIEGKSSAEIASQWNDWEIFNTRGRLWIGSHVLRVLTDPQYAAFVVSPEAREAWHRLAPDPSEVLSCRPGTWEPIVSTETWIAAQAAIRASSARNRFNTQTRWLLSGIATCAIERDGHICGALVFGSLAGRAYHPIYHCAVSSHLARRVDVADELVVARLEALILNLDGEKIPPLSPDPTLRPLERRLTSSLYAVTGQLDELADTGILTKAAARKIGHVRRGPLRAELAALRRRLLGFDTAALNRLITVGAPTRLREPDTLRKARFRSTWDELSLSDRRQIVESSMTVSLSSPGFGRLKGSDDAERHEHAARSVHIALREPFRAAEHRRSEH